MDVRTALHSTEEVDLDEGMPDRPSFTFIAALKNVALGVASNGPNYRVKFEVPVDAITRLSRFIRRGTLLGLRWTYPVEEGTAFHIGSSVTIPSRGASFGPNPDGDPVGIVTFIIPPGQISRGIGVLAAAVADSRNNRNTAAGSMEVVVEAEGDVDEAPGQERMFATD